MSTAASGTLFVVCAPSGAGKTSLVHALVTALPGLEVSVSHTTRRRRTGERAGRDYHFVSKAEFQSMIGAGDLLEHAVVYDHFYGTSRSWVMRTLTAADVVLEIDWQGARQVRAAFPACVSVQILPPSLGALEERLRRRGQDSDAAIARRMRAAIEEMAHFAEFDYLVVNDDFEGALRQLQAIVLAERARMPRMRRARAELISHLLRPSGRSDAPGCDDGADEARRPPPASGHAAG